MKHKRSNPRNRKTPTCLYHYTVVVRLPLIESSGYLVPASGGTEIQERPALWLTSFPDWDNTANKFYMAPDGTTRFGTRATTELFHGGLARIVVDPSAAPVSWPEFVNNSGISRAGAAKLAEVSRAKGSNPHDWWVSYEPIPVAEFVRVEVFARDCWVEREKAEPFFPAVLEAWGGQQVRLPFGAAAGEA